MRDFFWTFAGGLNSHATAGMDTHPLRRPQPGPSTKVISLRGKCPVSSVDAGDAKLIEVDRMLAESTSATPGTDRSSSDASAGPSCSCLGRRRPRILAWKAKHNHRGETHVE
jgi:hypothetical protein